MFTSLPRWKYAILASILAISFIYALPNLYGEDEAVQISGGSDHVVDQATADRIEKLLIDNHLPSKAIDLEDENTMMVRFKDAEAQLKAKDLIKKALGEGYSVALNLAPITPQWLQLIGAHPMKLGLDLRGGVHFLMEVDMSSVIARRVDGFYQELPKMLRDANIRYKKLERNGLQGFTVWTDNPEANIKVMDLLEKQLPELGVTTVERPGLFGVLAEVTPLTLREIRNETVEQTISTLRNRVNELGVAEAIVQRQGLNRVVVELPGIQDTAYAKDILGKTATLKFMLVDTEHDVHRAVGGEFVGGAKVFYDRDKRPVLLKSAVVLTGESITGASTGQDRDGRPAVQIRITGDISQFSRITRENIGQPMATVYVEAKDHKITESVINVATINSALGSQFQITGLRYDEARDLALLLRSGALPATLSTVEERIVGPSMGQENIRMGMISVGVGLALVMLFMAAYYSVCGIIANIALLANLILLVSILSLLGATLTLPGIAGIVLTLGMAVDANVLIFERIREELRQGLSPLASISRGYDYAFATIIDSNLTTLIVGVILFAIGSGPVKGFAVTLSIGILTSLLTATTGSRALMNLIYGGRQIKKVRVGI